MSAVEQVKDLIRKGQESIEKRIGVLEKYNEELQQKRERRVGMGQAPDEEFSFARAFYGAASRKWGGREFERDEMQRGAQLHRELGFGTGDGANVVPPEYVAQLIELLRPMTTVLESGATELNLTGGQPLQIPRQTGAVTADYKAEHVAATPSDVGLDQVTASPHTLTAASVYSNELLRLSNPSIEALVRNDIAQQFALAIDLYGLEGTGLTVYPAGVATYATDVAIDAAPDFDSLIDMFTALMTANAAQGSLGFIVHPRDYATLAKTKDSTGQYLLQPAVSQSQPATWWGIPVRMSTQIAIDGGTGADSNMYLGNWADLLVVNWGGMEIRASQDAEDYFLKNQTGIRGILMNDFAPRHDESFVIGSGVIP